MDEQFDSELVIRPVSDTGTITELLLAADAASDGSQGWSEAEPLGGSGE